MTLRTDQCLILASNAAQHIRKDVQLASTVVHTLSSLQWIQTFLSLPLPTAADLLAAMVEQHVGQDGLMDQVAEAVGNAIQTADIKNAWRVCFGVLLKPFAQQIGRIRAIGEVLLSKLLWKLGAESIDYKYLLEENLNAIGESAVFLVDSLIRGLSFDSNPSNEEALVVVLHTLRVGVEKVDAIRLKPMLHAIIELFESVKYAKNVSFTEVGRSKKEKGTAKKTISRKESVDKYEHHRLLSSLCERAVETSKQASSKYLLAPLFEAMSLLLLTAGHSDVSSKSVIQIIADDRFSNEMHKDKLETLACSLFKSYSKAGTIPSLLRLFISALHSESQQCAKVLISQKVLAVLGDVVRSMPRTHAVHCVEILCSAKHVDLSMIHLTIAVIIEAADITDQQQVINLAIHLLRQDQASENTLRDLRGSQLFLLGTLLVTSMRGPNWELTSVLRVADFLVTKQKRIAEDEEGIVLESILQGVQDTWKTCQVPFQTSIVRLLCILSHVALRKTSLREFVLKSCIVALRIFVKIAKSNAPSEADFWPGFSIESLSNAILSAHETLEFLDCNNRNLMTTAAKVARENLVNAGMIIQTMDYPNPDPDEGNMKGDSFQLTLSDASRASGLHSTSLIMSVLRAYEYKSQLEESSGETIAAIKVLWMKRHCSLELYTRLLDIYRSVISKGPKCRKTSIQSCISECFKEVKDFSGPSNPEESKLSFKRLSEFLLSYISIVESAQSIDKNSILTKQFEDEYRSWIDSNYQCLLSALRLSLLETKEVEDIDESGKYSSLLGLSMFAGYRLHMQTRSDVERLIVLLSNLIPLIQNSNENIAAIGWDMLAMVALISQRARDIVYDLLSILTRVSRTISSHSKHGCPARSTPTKYDETMLELFLFRTSGLAQVKRTHGKRRRRNENLDDVRSSILSGTRECCLYANIKEGDVHTIRASDSQSLLKRQRTSLTQQYQKDLLLSSQPSATAIYNWMSAIETDSGEARSIRASQQKENQLGIVHRRRLSRRNHVSWRQLRAWRQLLNIPTQNIANDLNAYVGYLDDVRQDLKVGFAADMLSSKRADRALVSTFLARHPDELAHVQQEIRIRPGKLGENTLLTSDVGTAYTGK